jgi:hypothetical protein
MMQTNISAVVLDLITIDKYSQPPKSKGKDNGDILRQDVIVNGGNFIIKDHSTIVCSFCNKRGHNKRSCESHKRIRNKNKRRWKKWQSAKSNLEGPEQQDKQKHPDQWDKTESILE